MIPPNLQNTMKRISVIQKNISNVMKSFHNTKKQSKKQPPNVSFKQRLENQLKTQNQATTQQTAENKATGKYHDIINKAAEKYSFSPNLIKAIIKVESDFNPNAVSRVGAKGLMQIMPVNFKSLGIKNPFNAQENIMSGTRFLRDMYIRFNKDMDKALAAYNAGPTRVAKHGIPKSVKKNYIDKVYKYLKEYGGN